MCEWKRYYLPFVAYFRFGESRVVHAFWCGGLKLGIKHTATHVLYCCTTVRAREHPNCRRSLFHKLDARFTIFVSLCKQCSYKR